MKIIFYSEEQKEKFIKNLGCPSSHGLNDPGKCCLECIECWEQTINIEVDEKGSN